MPEPESAPLIFDVSLTTHLRHGLQPRSGLALTAVVKYWSGAGEIINATVYRHPRPPPVFDAPRRVKACWPCRASYTQ